VKVIPEDEPFKRFACALVLDAKKNHEIEAFKRNHLQTKERKVVPRTSPSEDPPPHPLFLSIMTKS